MIAGNFSGGGTAAVGAAVAVPVITKETHAFIGDFASVSAKGGAGLLVKTGALHRRHRRHALRPVDGDLGQHDRPRLRPRALGRRRGALRRGRRQQHAFRSRTAEDGKAYYVRVVGPQSVQLLATPSSVTPIAISGGVGENHRLVPTNQAGVRADESPRFNPQKAGAIVGNTITLPDSHGLADDDAVIYTRAAERRSAASSTARSTTPT